MSPKEFVFDNPTKAVQTYLVWESKLKDMFKATPVFWYSVGMTSTQDGKHRVNVDIGKLTELKVDFDDIKMS